MIKLGSDMAAWRFSRSSNIDTDPGVIKQRARIFADAATGSKRGVTLVTRMLDDRSVERFLIGQQSNGQAAQSAASVISANVERIESLPELTTDVIAIAVSDSNGMPGNETQAGTNVAVVSEAFTASAEPGDWLAIHIIRSKKNHVRANREWRKGTQNHHSLDDRAVLISITAGSHSAYQTEKVITQVCAAMPGFDIRVKTQRIGIGTSNWLAAVLGASAFGATGVITGDWVNAGLVGAAPSAYFASAAFDMPNSRRVRTARRLSNGTFPAPGQAAHRERKTQDGSEPRPVAYPLSRNAFLVGGDVVIGLIASEASGSVDASITASRRVPAVLRSRIGPMFATDSQGAPIYLDATELYQSIIAMGLPGSGKSVLVRSLFGWVAAVKQRDEMIAGTTGRNTGIIAFETKAEGADYYVKWAHAVGAPIHRIDIADPSTPAIDMLGEGTHRQRAQRFFEQMKYAFEDNEVGSRAEEALVSIISAALWLLESGHSEQLYPQASFIKLTHVMLGGEGDANAITLANRVRDHAGKDSDVWKALGPFFGSSTTPSQRRTLTESSRNKVNKLLNLDVWFDASRPRVSWEDVLDGHHNIVLNMGASSSGMQISAEQTQIISSMLIHRLRSSVESTCVNWFNMGRSTYLFADELKILAGNSSEVIEWFREQGRAFGIRMVFATQRPNQLSADLRESVKGFGTLAWFTQNDGGVATMAAEDLSLGGSDWSTADVVNLPRFVAAMRTFFHGQRQVPFTASIAYFESDIDTEWNMSGWLDAQGLTAVNSHDATQSELPTRMMRAAVNETSMQDESSEPRVTLDKNDDAAPSPTFDPSDPNRFGTNLTAGDDNDF